MSDHTPGITRQLRPILERAKEVGLLGPGPVEAHVQHAFNYAVAYPAAPEVALDLGSGGGMPGLVLALVWPDSRWMLLDARDRSTSFLNWAVAEMSLTERVQVRRGRAEEIARESGIRHTFDLVTARGFAQPAPTAECATGFLKDDGILLVSEPPEDVDRWTPMGLQMLGMRREPSESPAIARIRQRETCGQKYPRRPGIPEKRPLF